METGPGGRDPNHEHLSFEGVLMPTSDADSVHSRIYGAYRTTTSANPYKVPTMPLEGQIRQYRQRWTRFLPADSEARILDIGCGGGEFLLFLACAGYSDTEGIDISPEQIDLARSRGLGQVWVADALEYIAGCQRRYTLINMQNVLEHLTRPNLFELLDAVVRVLEPHGQVFGVVPNLKSLLGSRVRYGDITHELSFTPESLRQIFAVVGLRPIAICEHGPSVHNVVSAVRWTVWQLVRLGIWVALVAEGADYRDRVYTQDMMFIAEKI